MADESKASDSPLRFLVVPNPPTVRGKPARVKTNATGTQLVYFTGRNVVIRDVENPTLALVFNQHRVNVTAATMSACGGFVASGDEGGNVLVWTVEAKPTVVSELKGCLGGPVNDIDFDPEAKNLIVVGGGGANIKVCTVAEGELLSEFVPSSKPFLSASWRRSGTTRIAVSNEDMSVAVYGGEPPYADPVKTLRDHKNYVNCVRFSPDGKYLATVSSDKQICFYDAETLEKLGRVKKAHAGSIYTCDWNAESTRLVTASADKHCKVWDAETREEIAAFKRGKTPDYMQVAAVHAAGTTAISLALCGELVYLDTAAPDSEGTIINSHQGGVSHLARAVTGEMIGAFSDGSLFKYTSADGTVVGTKFTGAAPKGVENMTTAGSQVVISGFGAKVTFGSVPDGALSAAVSTDKTATGLASFVAGDDTVTFVTTKRKILTFVNGERKAEAETKYDTTAAAATPDGSLLIVGGGDMKLHYYNVGADYSVTADGEADATRGAISCIAVSPDGKRFAAGDARSDIRLYELPERKCTVKKLWTNHACRVTSLAWNESSTFLASTALDNAVRTWNVERGSKAKAFENADGILQSLAL